MRPRGPRPTQVRESVCVPGPCFRGRQNCAPPRLGAAPTSSLPSGRLRGPWVVLDPPRPYEGCSGDIIRPPRRPLSTGDLWYWFSWGERIAVRPIRPPAAADCDSSSGPGPLRVLIRRSFPPRLPRGDRGKWPAHQLGGPWALSGGVTAKSSMLCAGPRTVPGLIDDRFSSSCGVAHWREPGGAARGPAAPSPPSRQSIRKKSKEQTSHFEDPPLVVPAPSLSRSGWDRKTRDELTFAPTPSAATKAPSAKFATVKGPPPSRAGRPASGIDPDTASRWTNTTLAWGSRCKYCPSGLEPLRAPAECGPPVPPPVERRSQNGESLVLLPAHS